MYDVRGRDMQEEQEEGDEDPRAVVTCCAVHEESWCVLNGLVCVVVGFWDRGEEVVENCFHHWRAGGEDLDEGFYDTLCVRAC